MEIKILKSLYEIPNGNYIGYYWCSGAKNPIQLNGQWKMDLDKESLFIQEAMLWDQEKKISIMIQHTHRQIITQYDLIKVSDNDLHNNSICYVGHRMRTYKKVKFYRHWEEVPDPLCIGLPVLKMKAQIFVGFE